MSVLGDNSQPRPRQSSRPDLNPFRNQAWQAIPSGNRSEYQSSPLVGNSGSPRGTDFFSNPGQVSLDGSYAFTHVGRDIYNLSPPITLSVDSHRRSSTSPTPSSSSSVPSDPSTGDLHGSMCYPHISGEHESETYARLLLPKKQGWPLWQPSPLNNLPAAYRRKGVGIGDVGVITADGEFDFFFNICRPANDPVNRNSVPEHFEPINHPQNPEDVSYRPSAWLPGKYLSTNSISATTTLQTINNGGNSGGGVCQYQYTATAPGGALLMTPCGGSRENLLNTAPYHSYAKQHAISWYKHINGTRGRGVHNGSVYLITGVDKTRAWGNSVYSGIPEGKSHNIVFRKANPNGWESVFSHVWAEPHVLTMNQGPIMEYFDGHTTLPENQCIFLRGFRVALSEGLWGSIMGGVEVSPIQDHESMSDSLLQKSGRIPFNTSSWLGLGNILGSDYFGSTATRGTERAPNFGSESVITISEIPIPSTKLHPLDIINQRLLAENPSASIAITHDSVWLSALDEGADTLPSPAELVSRVWKKYVSDLSENSVTLMLRSNPNSLPPGGNSSNLETTQQLFPFGYSAPHATNPNGLGAKIGKRPREEEPVPGPSTSIENVGASSSAVVNEPSPLKRMKTNWDVPPREESKNDQEAAENVKDEGDASAFLEQMTELIREPTSSSDISETLDMLLKGCGNPTDGLDLSSLSAFGEPSTLGSSMEDFSDFFDQASFSNTQADIWMVPTPELSTSSSVNPSPESGSESEAAHHFTAVGSDAKVDEIPELRLGPWKEIDGGESAYYQSPDWKWDGLMSTQDQPWAL